MKRRAERQQIFDTVKDDLYAAGIATVKAAKAQEDMFTTTLEALTDAYETNSIPQLEASTTEVSKDLNPIIEKLQQIRQTALEEADYDAYVAIETKIQHIEELAVLRLERQVRQLNAQHQLAKLSTVKPESNNHSPKVWTEANLKAQYETLSSVKAAFNIKARTWKEALTLLNQAET